MPFPAAIVWGAAALIGAAGVKKGVDAYSDTKKAKEIGEKVERRYKRAEKDLEADRKKTQEALETLGRVKIAAFKNQIKHLVDLHNKYKSHLTGFNEDITIENLKEVERMVLGSLELENGFATGAGAGALAAWGAYGSVGLLGGTAGTGVAIGGLTGAAAKSATLAWLGGGTLASGGFGVAGGMVALGGIALAPLLAVGGFYAASKAEKALTQAEEYDSKVDVAVEQMKGVKLVTKGIRTSAAEMVGVITEMCERFDKVRVDNMDDPDAFKRMFLVGKGLKQILDVPVLKDDGTANDNIRHKCEGYLALGA